MSFVADELVKWRKEPPWYDRMSLNTWQASAMSRSKSLCTIISP